jgi:hypothetical protein
VSPFTGLEDRLKTLIEDAVRDAEQHAGAIDQVIYTGLTDVGVPAPWAQTVADEVKMLIDHFQSDHAPAQPEPAPEPQPDPGVPQP